MYDISKLKSDITGTMHGTSLAQITGVDNLIYRAARKLLLDLDPQETKRTVEMTNPIYDQVYDYAAPSDLKGNRIIDLKPQVARTLRDSYSQLYNKDFDLIKTYTLQPSFTIEFNNAIKTIRIDSPMLNTGITLNECDDLTSNGVWATGGSASNLISDNLYYVSGGSSLKFQLAAGGSSGYLENSTMTAQDLTEHYLNGSVFYYVYLPTAANFTSVNLRWGSSASDYWTATATAQFDGTALQNGWNLLQTNWPSTATGTPNVAAVNYLRVTYNYNGTQMVGVHLDDIVSRLGVIMEIEYYSKYMFRDVSTGAFKEFNTSDTDLINLDTETYNVFLSLCVLYCVQQAFGGDANYDTSFWLKEYEDGLARYRGLYKSEAIKPQSTYYRKPNPSWRRFFGRGYNY